MNTVSSISIVFFNARRLGESWTNLVLQKERLEQEQEDFTEAMAEGHTDIFCVKGMLQTHRVDR